MEIRLEDIFHVGVAMLIGLIIGSEREYRSKAAGLRTLMLVSVGSCIFTILSLRIGLANPDRMAANIITGIGFLGAGAIFKDDNKINGITTATTIWVCAALGMCVGSGNIFLAFAGAVSVLSVLSLLIFLETFIDNKSRARDYRIVCSYTNDTLQHYETMFGSYHLKITRGTQSISRQIITGHWRLTGNKKSHQQLIELLLADPTILELDF